MSSRRFLTLFLLCALVPLAAAWASLRFDWFAAAPTLNHGEWLTQELRLLPPPAQGGGQWHLVYVPAVGGEAACPESGEALVPPGVGIAPTAPATRCEQALMILQQLHAGLGRKQARVQALVLAADNPAVRARYPHVEWQAAQVSDAARVVETDLKALLDTPESARAELCARIESGLVQLRETERCVPR